MVSEFVFLSGCHSLHWEAGGERAVQRFGASGTQIDRNILQLYRSKALFTSHPNPKYFLFHPSHQIFRRMHEALNVGKKDN
jgi:hypothetical protein